MADVDHPKTHVEDQDLEGGSRTQPESPHHEGIDPLTESDTMYPAEDTKSDSEKLSKKLANTAHEHDNSQSTVDAQVHLGEDDTASDTAADSTANHEESDKAAADTPPANADGKLPKDAQIANKVSSDKQNTSASNKPATQAAPAGTTDSKTASK